jgi:hypothetical protein
MENEEFFGSEAPVESDCVFDAELNGLMSRAKRLGLTAGFGSRGLFCRSATVRQSGMAEDNFERGAFSLLGKLVQEPRPAARRLAPPLKNCLSFIPAIGYPARCRIDDFYDAKTFFRTRSLARTAQGH